MDLLKVPELHMFHMIVLRSDVDRIQRIPMRTAVAGRRSVLVVGLLLIAGLAASATGADAQGHVRRAGDRGFLHDLQDTRGQAEGAEVPPAIASDRAVLEALYRATGGPNWKNRTNWLTDAPLDQWFGVETDGSGSVTALWPHSNNLTGTIPPELGRLANLSFLQLDSNNLTGTIPPEVGNLAKLEYLSLHDNQLTGTIPPELGRLTNLGRLYLGVNRLTGPIPPQIGNLSGLRTLGLLHKPVDGLRDPLIFH